MSRMRQVTHYSTQDHESNLDALLEDLQTTVSRSNSQLNLNGTMTTGYREIRRTVTDGTPHGTMSEYQIEYVKPANSSQHLSEMSHSYNESPSQRINYRAETSYNYNTAQSDNRSSGRSDSKLKQNISELDSLLDDLNSAQKKGFAENTTIVRHTGGVDPGLLEPVTSTPSGGRVIEEKHYREEKVIRERSTSPRRELVFTGTRSRDPSPIAPVRQQFFRYEKTTTSRTTGPAMGDMAPDSSQILRNNNLAIEDSSVSLRNRSPSPGGNRIEYHYSNSSTTTGNRDPQQYPTSPGGNRIEYHYSNSSTTTGNRDPQQYPTIEKVPKYKEQHDGREYSPQRYTSGKTNNSYMYSSSSTTRESRSEVPKSPPPHRSPSPVSFNPPSSPGIKTKGPYSYDPPPQPQSPQPQRFPPASPQNTHSSYRYTTTTTTNNYSTGNRHPYPEDEPLMPRPFPSHSPTPPPGEQQPPKRLDELMASFSDTEIRNRRNEAVHNSYQRYERDNRETDQLNQSLIPNGHGRERIIEREREKSIEKQIVKKEESKNVAGPPVYYPPGVELFSKKEESMAQYQRGGAMYKAKGKYEYESKSKSKTTESSGKAVVPVCLPLCCAMPCTII